MNFRLPLALLLAAFLCGCASGKGTVQIQSLNSNHRFAQPFAEAYATRSDDGTYDVVMVQNSDSPSTKPGAPLQPVAGMPMRQIVHVRVLWKPLRFGRSDAPTAASNATIDWFVLSEDAQQRMNMLHYQGGGLVMVYGSDDAPRIVIRNAEIKPVAAAGDLADPIGASKLTGKIPTQRDAGRVQVILDELKTATAAAQAPPGPAAASQ